MNTIMVCWEKAVDDTEAQVIASRAFASREDAWAWIEGKQARYAAAGVDCYISQAGCLVVTAPPKKPGKCWLYDLTPEGTKDGPALTGLSHPCHKCHASGLFRRVGCPDGICFRCEGKGHQNDADRTRNHWYDVFRERRIAASIKQEINQIGQRYARR